MGKTGIFLRFNRPWNSRPREVHLLDSAGWAMSLSCLARSEFLEGTSRILWPKGVRAGGRNGLLWFRILTILTHQLFCFKSCRRVLSDRMGAWNQAGMGCVEAVAYGGRVPVAGKKKKSSVGSSSPLQRLNRGNVCCPRLRKFSFFLWLLRISGQWGESSVCYSSWRG